MPAVMLLGLMEITVYATGEFDRGTSKNHLSNSPAIKKHLNGHITFTGRDLFLEDRN